MTEAKFVDFEQRLALIKQERLLTEQKIKNTKQKIAELDVELQKTKPSEPRAATLTREQRVESCLRELRRLIPAGKKVVILDGVQEVSARPEIELSKKQSSIWQEPAESPTSEQLDEQNDTGTEKFDEEVEDLSHKAELSVFSFEEDRSTHYALCDAFDRKAAEMPQQELDSSALLCDPEISGLSDQTERAFPAPFEYVLANPADYCHSVAVRPVESPAEMRDILAV